MTIESISADNIIPLAQLMLELWPDSSLDEERASCEDICCNEMQTCYLVRAAEGYVAFLHVTLRQDYVEGAHTAPVGYIEGIYVKEAYRQLGLARRLVAAAEDWVKQKGCKQLASDAEIGHAVSIEFHKKSGFTEVNRIVCFIKEL